MNTYTFIAEFREGTYISQVKEINVSAAMVLWGETLDLTQIKFLGKKSKSAILEKLTDEEATRIDGMDNVWGFCLKLKTGFLMVNVVKTAEQ